MENSISSVVFEILRDKQETLLSIHITIDILSINFDMLTLAYEATCN